MKDGKTVQEVNYAVGGKENISSCTNCMTRLRLALQYASGALACTSQKHRWCFWHC
ncbi:MAG: PTS transporter subunit EIIB [Psychromonas sp.]|nr:PTS transporter subunit EIIB [Psychromonas sp.]